MRALVQVKNGSPDEALKIEQRPDPAPGPGQVRIKVKASGINFADLMARVGLYPDAPKLPCVMGYEVAGEIDEVGADADGLTPGQRVMAGVEFGGFAELAVVEAQNVVPLPASFNFEQGAAYPVVYGTAFVAINQLAEVKQGETVLVNSAAGGVGIAAIQILRDIGAEIIGTASASKHDFLREQGVAHTIDYHTQDVKAEVMRITKDAGVDVVLDALGNFHESLGLLKPDGRMVMYGVSNLMAGDKRSIPTMLKGVAKMFRNLPRFNPVKLMNGNKSKKVGGKTVYGLNMLHLWQQQGSLEDVMQPMDALLERGVFTPVVAKAFPLEQAGEAHRYIQDRKNVGKVVLTP